MFVYTSSSNVTFLALVNTERLARLRQLPVFYSESEYSTNSSTDSGSGDFITAIDTPYRSVAESTSQASGENGQAEASSSKKRPQLDSPFQYNPLRRALRASKSAVRAFGGSIKNSVRSGSRRSPTSVDPPEGSPAPAASFQGTSSFLHENSLPSGFTYAGFYCSPTGLVSFENCPPQAVSFDGASPDPVPLRGPGRPPPPSRHPFVNPLRCHPPNGPPNLERVTFPIPFEGSDCSPSRLVSSGASPYERPSCYPRVDRFEGSSLASSHDPFSAPDDSPPAVPFSWFPLKPSQESRRVGVPFEDSSRFHSPRVVLPSEDSSPLVPYGDPRRVVIPFEDPFRVPFGDLSRPPTPSPPPFINPLTGDPPDGSPNLEPVSPVPLEGPGSNSDDEPTFHPIIPPIPPNAPRLAFATLHREPGVSMDAAPPSTPTTPESRTRGSTFSPPSATEQISEAFIRASSGSAYASPPRAHGRRRRRPSTSSSTHASPASPPPSSPKTPEAQRDLTPRDSPTSPPPSPTSSTLSLREMIVNQVVVGGQAVEKLVSASPASPPGENTDPIAVQAARRALWPGYESPLCLIEWFYTGHSWDDISRDTEVLQMQLSSENIISPTGAPAAKHRKVATPKDDTTPTPSRPASPVSSDSSSDSSTAGPSGAPDLTESGVDSGTDNGINLDALSLALKAAIESSFRSVSLPTTPKAAKEARNKGTSSVSTPESPITSTEDKGEAPIKGKARNDGKSPDGSKAPSVKWKWPERKSSLPKKKTENVDDGLDLEFHTNQLLPLPEFRRLHTLRLTDMLGSHQPDIWLACWVNVHLEILVLEMKHRPSVYAEVGHFKPKWISGDWSYKYKMSGRTVYLYVIVMNIWILMIRDILTLFFTVGTPEKVAWTRRSTATRNTWTSWRWSRRRSAPWQWDTAGSTCPSCTWCCRDSSWTTVPSCCGSARNCARSTSSGTVSTPGSGCPLVWQACVASATMIRSGGRSWRCPARSAWAVVRPRRARLPSRLSGRWILAAGTGICPAGLSFSRRQGVGRMRRWTLLLRVPACLLMPCWIGTGASVKLGEVRCEV